MIKSSSGTSLEEIDWHERLLNWNPNINNRENEETVKNEKMIKYVKKISIAFIFFFLAGVIFYFYFYLI